MTDFNLQRLENRETDPLVFIIMDGVGLYKGEKEGYPGNALDKANASTIKSLMQEKERSMSIKAHGLAVGLPSDEDMGNSEVGHNALGAGRVFSQGAQLVSQAIEKSSIFQGEVWREYIGSVSSPGIALKKKSNGEYPGLHFIGLLSDGNVHSHINHLLAMISEAAQSGVQKIFVHILLDGRDVEKASAHTYIENLEKHLAMLDPERKKYFIASGGGRMVITMDRYEADWDMVKKGWQTHVEGKARAFSDALTAVKTLRSENPDIIDQDLPPFIIESEGRPVGPIENGDIVIFFNFRGDRAIELSRAFTEENFSAFNKEKEVKVHYAGMMEYDGDLKIPPRYLVAPPAIDRTLSEYLVHNGISQFALSETQKFGHVTYFWNGNNSEKFDDDLEEWLEIPSDRISFDKAPRMQADKIGDAMVNAMASGKYRFLRVNFPNGDMVGHTGNLQAAIEAVESVDQNIKKILTAAEKLGFTVLITADHGNCDQMLEVDKKSGEAKKNPDGSYTAKTSHTLSPVPLILCGHNADQWKFKKDLKEPGLANLAATILNLLDFKAPADYLPSLLERSGRSK